MQKCFVNIFFARGREYSFINRAFSAACERYLLLGSSFNPAIINARKMHPSSLSLAFLCIKKSKKEGTFFPRTKNILSLRRKKVCQWQQSSAEEKTRDKKDRALENKKATIRKVSYSFMLGTNKHIMYMSGRKEIIYLSKILPL